EATVGRVRRRAPPSRLCGRLRRARRCTRRRQLPRRPGAQRMSGPFPEGAYRRRIRLVTTGLGEVEGGLEDDFHHFEVTIRCDDEQVTDVEGRARRWPWTTCPDAAVPLRQLEGMPLS